MQETSHRVVNHIALSSTRRHPTLFSIGLFASGMIDPVEVQGIWCTDLNNMCWCVSCRLISPAGYTVQHSWTLALNFFTFRQVLLEHASTHKHGVTCQCDLTSPLRPDIQCTHTHHALSSDTSSAAAPMFLEKFSLPALKIDGSLLAGIGRHGGLLLTLNVFVHISQFNCSSI